MEKIDKIIQTPEMLIKTGKIIRHKYEPYNISKALNVIDYIGQRLDSNFKIDPNCMACYQQLVMYFHGDAKFKGDLTKGIAILGATGTGKSIAMAIMKQYRNIDNIKYIQFGKNLNFDYLIASTQLICESFQTTGQEGLYKYFNRNILCIDDLGIEPKESLYFGNRIDVISDLLYHRYNNNKITFITSNLTPEKLHTFYGDRLYSRFHEMFNFIYLTGKDRRI